MTQQQWIDVSKKNLNPQTNYLIKNPPLIEGTNVYQTWVNSSDSRIPQSLLRYGHGQYPGHTKMGRLVKPIYSDYERREPNINLFVKGQIFEPFFNQQVN